ncbi:MAG: LTA synthase family protein [Bacteroidales bacterium]|nr:LTA synthase family protein [Bacteroidales bacterium]
MKRILPDIKRALGSVAAYMVYNLLLAMVMLMLARFVFVAWNWHLFRETMCWSDAWGIFRGGVRFDLCTLFYVNGLWIVLLLLPLPWKERRGYYLALRIIYLVTNLAAFMLNLFDVVYVTFTGRRTTGSFMAEFSHDSNGGSVVGQELMRSWPLVLLTIAAGWFIWRVYFRPPIARKPLGWRYYAGRIVTLALTVLIAIASIRGGLTRTTRPITLSNAYQYVHHPLDAAAVLNTPFSVIRTLGKPAFVTPQYMSSDEAESIYSYHHRPATPKEVALNRPNIVILIVESFSRGYIGALNREINDSTFEGWTPRMDTLIDKSKSYKHSYANGMKSIDGMPSVLSSIPMMIEPFFLTPASLNDLSSIAGYLGEWGYTSAFFHGAPNGSMGFEAYANHCGFDRYVGLTEFCESTRHNGMDDFDGTWAIWDEPFLQFFAEELNEMPQPFVAGVFTASSHHPFKVPDEYAERFPEEGPHPLLKCIRYADYALGEFFETASKMPWYDNTLFVLTSDHSMVPVLTEYSTDLERYAAPIVFFAPGDSTMQGMDYERVAQQIDILPTVLNYIGYDKPYVAFGVDLFNTAPEQTWAFSFYNELYQFTRDGLFLQFYNDRPHAAYYLPADPMLENDLLPALSQGESVKFGDRTITPQTLEENVRFLKAFIQQYCNAMSTDDLLPRADSGSGQ